MATLTLMVRDRILAVPVEPGVRIPQSQTVQGIRDEIAQLPAEGGIVGLLGSYAGRLVIDRPRVHLLGLIGSPLVDAGVDVKAPDCTVERVTARAPVGRGIYMFSNSDRATIRGCTVEDTAEDGIATQRPDTFIENCTLRRVGRHSIWVLSGTIGAIIRRNLIEDGVGMGIELIEAIAPMVEHNVVQRCGKVGIHGLRTVDAVVRHNDCHWNLNNGIDFNGSTGAFRVHANRCSHNGSAELEGNGILVYRSQGLEGNRAEVTGNLCWNNSQGQGTGTGRDGIRVSQLAGDAAVTDLLVARNTCWDDQPTKTQAWGVNVNGEPRADRITITPNNLLGNRSGSLRLAGLLPGGANTTAPNLI